MPGPVKEICEVKVMVMSAEDVTGILSAYACRVRRPHNLRGKHRQGGLDREAGDKAEQEGLVGLGGHTDWVLQVNQEYKMPSVA